MHVIGMDFGTSNSVAVLRAPDGRTRSLLIDGHPILPSALFCNSDDQILVGRAAERAANSDPSRFEPNPKRRIDDGSIFLGLNEIQVADAIAHVLSEIASESTRQLGQRPAEVRVTHPARWGQRRRTILSEAAVQAGFQPPTLIPEPVAAASYFTTVLGTEIAPGRSLAIYDLGGGTFDATVVRRTQTGFEVLAEEGVSDIGGLDLDHAIVEHLGSVYGVQQPEEWEALTNPTDQSHRRYRRLLYEDVRAAKENLSRSNNAEIHLPALEIDAHLTRSEFERAARPKLAETVDCLGRAISAARLRPQDLVNIFLVGGSSRIPMISQLIHEKLGVPAQAFEQPETVVAEGAVRASSAPPPPSSAPAGPVSGGTPQASAPPAMPQSPGAGMPPGGGQMPAAAPGNPMPAPPPMQSASPQGPPRSGKRPLHQEPAVLVTAAIVAILIVIFTVIIILRST
ncbi:Hsp70 family protein [Haloglycomyces albus]|uniref:Hsp70 family protein n=1 Tax=Haloglycomyces albus TaxID=526067 RepID=UPI00046D48A9|nr:Hsp70 family protein [Haloglycomyces albus]